MIQGTRQTILVIDNDDGFSRALGKRLTSSGLRCITASGGLQGLAAFEANAVDLVVSDLNMPGGDGVDLADTIRRTSTVPIIFVTGFRDEFKRRLRGIVNVTTLRKPFDSQELIDLIASSLASH